jgi:hypothetical protein
MDVVEQDRLSHAAQAEQELPAVCPSSLDALQGDVRVLDDLVASG